MDFQSNLEMMEDTEFEGKVDIDDLVLPSKQIESAEIEINGIKQEPLEEDNQDAIFEMDHDFGKTFRMEMEENILSLYEELDKEKSENSVMGFSLRRSLKVRQFVERSKNVIHFQKIKESSHSYANFVMNLFFKFMK